ncbi:winged helix-turn-helix transcriptional regulator [Frankia nepalensis]|uniref:winged helix-turn-helix transcriptional regulator n=1 Tax=Frankia nepalensis TaxID=1836974 RepID=UPI0027DDAC78|nr:winged helix-turn-helix transcriptional regulator [Frankia nepalensis]
MAAAPAARPPPPPPPQHVEYALTELGKTLQAPLAAICAWAVTHQPAEAAEDGRPAGAPAGEV